MVSKNLGLALVSAGLANALHRSNTKDIRRSERRSRSLQKSADDRILGLYSAPAEKFNFNENEFQNSKAYRWKMMRGREALLNSMNAQGSGKTSTSQKQLLNFYSQLLDDQYNTEYDRQYGAFIDRQNQRNFLNDRKASQIASSSNNLRSDVQGSATARINSRGNQIGDYNNISNSLIGTFGGF